MADLREENSIKTDGGPYRDMPLVKTFRTPRGYYFYDVNRDVVCPVGEEAYNEIDRMLSGRDSGGGSKSIRELKENGYLSSNRIAKITHPFTDSIEAIASHKMRQLTLQVTQSCNLCCTYCPYASNKEQKYQRAASNKAMDWDTAKRAIDFFAAHSDRSEEVFVSFYGGEPLIAYPLIRQSVAYAERIFEGKNLKFGMTTNATLLTDEMIRFFAQKKFYLLFSLDGPREIHDRHRLRIDGSTTYDSVMDALEKTVACYGKDSGSYVAINMVIDPADSLDKIKSWLEDPLFSRIRVHCGLVNNEQLEERFEITKEYRAKSTYIHALAYLDYLKLVDGLKGSPLTDTTIVRMAEEYSELQNDAGSLPVAGVPGGPCLPGVKNLFVNTAGVFYPCEKVNEMSQEMVIGSLEKGFDYGQMKKQMNIARWTSEECRNCWAQVHCNICQKFMGNDSGSLSGPEKKSLCSKSKGSFMETLYTCTLIKECKTLYDPPARKERLS